MVPISRLVTEGEQAFAIPTPQLWNSLPGDLWQPNSVSPFTGKVHSYKVKLYEVLIHSWHAPSTEKQAAILARTLSNVLLWTRSAAKRILAT